MRRLATPLLLWTLIVGGAVAAPAAVSAQAAPAAAAPAPGADLPAGFTDGVPVGGTDRPTDVQDAAAPAAGASTSAATTVNGSSTRYFGQGPWDAINEAASATSRCSSLSPASLTALVVAPIFKESSAATSPATAPSPMTLSRWDEWNGTYSTTSNNSANYGLYAFRDPYTAYPRAYWHPGIGIWQYDSAGVGAPFTAIERMNVRTVAGDVAAGMASRYCNPSSSIVGHGAPYTEQDRRNSAWWPWWAGDPNRSCPLCQAEFDRMTASTPYFANISLVSGISATGGAVKRSCTLPGTAATVECWYVDPSVGVIQGATAWATYSPDGKGSPTVAPAPLSAPFYVIKRNGREERHWLGTDSGYGTDISGTRQLGLNERPRSNQAGSGITWTASSGLCDLDTGHGSCNPRVPPTNDPMPAPAGSGLTSTAVSVGGIYHTVSLDANGDQRGDILWYAPGSASDYLWLGEGNGTFTSVGVSINGDYEVKALDIDGNGRDDLLFSSTKGGVAYIWESRGDGTFTSAKHVAGSGRQPLVLDQDHDGRDEVFWYGPGGISDALWSWTGSTLVNTPMSVGGVYEPLVGDFDRNGDDDILWYRPGTGQDWLWLHKRSGGYQNVALSVNGSYQPIVGDFDGARGDDIVWYKPGAGADYTWFAAGGGAFTSQSLSANYDYEPVVADLEADGRDDIVWQHRAGTADLWTRWSASQARTSVAVTLVGQHRGIVGSFSTGGTDGILWYAAGGAADALWSH